MTEITPEELEQVAPELVGPESSEKSEPSELLEPGPAEVLDLRGEPIDEIGEAPVPDPPKKAKVKIPVVPAEQDGKFPAPVKVESLVFRARMKNSQSVRLVQGALKEQGYEEAGRDVQGWLCEGTQAALARFQVEHGLVGSGNADEATVEALFAGSATHYWER